MKTKTINIYTFNELSTESKEKAISDNYEINISYDWWSYLLDDYCEELKENYGIEINKDTFGFSLHRQGAGACFTFDIIDYKKFIHSIELREHQLEVINKLDILFELDIYKVNYHYSHEHTYEIDITETTSKEDSKELNEIIDQVQSIVKLFYINIQKQLYSKLLEEYEYLTSNEAISETLMANEYEFLEDGSRA